MGLSVVTPTLGPIMRRIQLLTAAHFLFGVIYSLGTVSVELETASLIGLLAIVMGLSVTLTTFLMWTAVSRQSPARSSGLRKHMRQQLSLTPPARQSTARSCISRSASSTRNSRCSRTCTASSCVSTIKRLERATGQELTRRSRPPPGVPSAPSEASSSSRPSPSPTAAATTLRLGPCPPVSIRPSRAPTDDAP
jgi:hypothetical protein